MRFSKHTIHTLLYFSFASLCLILILELQVFSSLRSFFIQYLPFFIGKRTFLSNFLMGICASSVVSLIPALFDYRNKFESFLKDMALSYMTQRLCFLEHLGEETIEFINEQHLNGNIKQYTAFLYDYANQKYLRKWIIIRSLSRKQKEFIMYDQMASVYGKLSSYYQKRVLYHQQILILNDTIKTKTEYAYTTTTEELNHKKNLEKNIQQLKANIQLSIRELDNKIVDTYTGTYENWYQDNRKIGG